MIKPIAQLNGRHWLTAMGLSVIVGLFPSCEKDILEGQPEWLGNSIYERLEEGIEVNGEVLHFNTMIRLINDLDQTSVLSKTGSKTLFVASDEAFDEWFRTNDQGVRSYEQLSETQKKTLLNNAMINNAYLLELLTNVSGNPPQEGLCMRRATASSILDTVYTMSPEDMPVDPMIDPEKDTWASFRQRGKSIKMFKDNTSAPMIHFLPKFMTKNKITSEDLKIITNGRSESNLDSWINGRKVISAEQTCKNGYVYVVDGVIEPSRSMAEIITENPKTQLWAKMMNRFSVPIYDYSNSREYNRIHNTTGDSIFTMRYFSDWTNEKESNVSGKLMYVPNTKDLAVPGRLTFDPGWNQYMYSNPMGYDMHYDAGAMIVPTDEAVQAWWNGAGKSLQDQYGSLDSIPIKTLSKLIRVHMLPSFIESVPSKFRTIVDDAKVELGIEPSDVKECKMGCNGVVYISDKVFPPSEYRSVVYPALASQSLMGVIYYAIDNYDFGPFLNSMESTFSMILPYNTNKSINPSNTEEIYMQYIDPATYGLSQQVLYEFYFMEKAQKVKANRYVVSFDENNEMVLESSLSEATDTDIKNRLSDMVDNLIIIGTLSADKKYYKTKAGSVIYANYKGKSDVEFAGGWQLANNQTIQPVDYQFMTEGSNGNGTSYCMTTIPQTSPLSVYEILKAHAKADEECTCEADSAYRAFFELLSNDPTDNALLSSSDGNYVCANNENQANMNIRLFDNYNYTVYVPTNKSIRELIASGALPTWKDYEDNLENEATRNFIAERIQNFLRYHIQDNSVLIGGDPVDGIQYETSKLNEATRRFYSVTINANSSALTVTDQLQNKATVLTNSKLYNHICREYWLSVSGKGAKATRSLISSSNAVVHQIDQPLFFDKGQLDNWKYAGK